MHDVAHREFDDLAGLGARDVLNLNDPGRDVPRRCVVPDLFLDALDQPGIERVPLLQLDKEHDTHVVISARRPLLANHQRLEYFRQLFDLPIDFRRADTLSLIHI